MMSKLFTPTLRISIGLVGLTVTLLFSAYILGLLPDERGVEIEARAKIAEALAVQLANAASRNDIISVQETIASVVKRNKSILSIGLRRSMGELVIAAGEHKQHWVKPHNQHSTPTHVQVALKNGGTDWGQLEFAFAPLKATDQIAGIPQNIAIFVGFLVVFGLIGNYFFLRRALKELDPGNVIPERVHSAFNSLAEGVLILDERGLILLANNSFAKATKKDAKSLFGSQIDNLNWQQRGESTSNGEPPWRIAIRDQINVTAVKMGYRSNADNFKIFMVNATCILDESSNASGVIVTFDDVTALEQKNDDLVLAVRELQKSEEEISHQNHELQYLANHDPLTGCLNRRAFFTQFADQLERAHLSGISFTCLMVDLDRFKSINDNFGHAVGDEVIAGMANILNANARETDIVGRYGGEEFCVALIDRTRDECQWIADQIREQVISQSPNWLNSNEHTTTSIGIAFIQDEYCSVKHIVNRADQALYAAKNSGRNKVVFWDEIMATGSQISSLDSNAIIINTTSTSKTQMNINTGPSASLESVKASSLSPIEAKSFCDPLAKLPSELIFKDRVSQSIIRGKRNNKKVAVLQISLDSIERLSADFGESASRELATSVTTRFTKTLRQSDTVSLFDGGNKIPTLSHLDGDKFLVELSDLNDENTITWIIKRLFQSLSKPLTIEGEKIFAACNIGVSIHPGDGNDAETLIRHAGIAQKHAEEFEETNNVQFFSAAMNEYSQRQLTLQTSIRQAIDENEFSLFFQPIIDAASGRLNSMETLLRCNNPIFSGMPIGQIISVAEQSGLIIEIGEWVALTAIKQAEQWISSGIRVPSISVNLSAVQLSDPHAMERVIQIILEMDLPPRKLQLEITETAILKDVEAAGLALMRLQQQGVMVVLDDFGTGQSSLSYLRRFRPDILKLDRCFIGEITTSDADENLVSAIVAMSQRMGLRVVAEGVETKSQLDKVRDMGCDDIQGFYIAKPMSTDNATSWLRSTGQSNIIEAVEKKNVLNNVA